MQRNNYTDDSVYTLTLKSKQEFKEKDSAFSDGNIKQLIALTIPLGG